MPTDSSGEQTTSVRAYHKMLSIKDLLQGNLLNRWWDRDRWPVTSGNYLVGERKSPVAICTLTSPQLMEPLQKAEGTAIVGRLVTANLGIEKIIRNIISNPNIRYLLLCGEDSPVFHPGQTLHSLFEKGVDSDHRIIEAQGHYPVLINIDRELIEHFRNHIVLIDCTGEGNLDALQRTIMRLGKAETALRLGVDYEQDHPIPPRA
ncbi:Tetrahydromethanopterin S-methyltransferase, subunit A [Fodinibius sediminis]|uniref:Tetrahydromethanopterin S-methyltransferase, subunit A n=2 Tax=Fodinibius sediminis TaxID=1214077 RepID=A0A521EFL4_9BACT|nr:Tetrahydromethanopterin S-methyltransferase, subunit A [Fodinibius sediminis]